MSGFLTWMKSNIIIVILGILTIIPLPAAWYVAGGMNKKLREERQSEAQRALSDVRSATINYSVPPLSLDEDPITDSGPPNAIKIEFYKVEREKREAIIAGVKNRAVEFNSKGRGVLLDGLFPLPESLAAGQILRPEFVDRVLATSQPNALSAYDELFKRLRIRPSLDEEILGERLGARQSALMGQLAPGVSANEIDEATRDQISKQLVEQRLGAYETHARDTNFYADASILPASVPVDRPAVDPSIEQCFGWQYDFWLIEDVLSAIASSNDRFDTTGVGGSVLDGVVKRVESIEFEPNQFASAGASSESTPAFDMFGGGRDGETADAAAFERNRLVWAQADAERSRTNRYGGGAGGFIATGPYTGREEGGESQLYDVRTVKVTMIASYEKLPSLINSVSSYNFMTVLDADIYSVDAWDQISQGYYSGTDYLVRVELEIETLWLRSWTKEFMPPSVRTQLGIPEDMPTDGPA